MRRIITWIILYYHRSKRLKEKEKETLSQKERGKGQFYCVRQRNRKRTFLSYTKNLDKPWTEIKYCQKHPREGVKKHNLTDSKLKISQLHLSSLFRNLYIPRNYEPEYTLIYSLNNLN